MKRSAKDLRLRTKDVLDAVDRGEEITITHRGKPRAKLIPIRQPKDEANPLFGLWADNDISPEEYVDEKRKRRFG